MIEQHDHPAMPKLTEQQKAFMAEQDCKAHERWATKFNEDTGFDDERLTRGEATIIAVSLASAVLFIAGAALLAEHLTRRFF